LPFAPKKRAFHQQTQKPIGGNTKNLKNVCVFWFLGALRGETIQSTACLQGVLQGDLWNPKLLSILLEEIIRYSQQVVLPSQKQTPETKKLN